MNDYIFVEKHPTGLYQLRTLIEGAEHIFDYDPALDLQAAMQYAQMTQERLLKDGIVLPTENIVVSIEALQLNAATDLASYKAMKNMKRRGLT